MSQTANPISGFLDHQPFLVLDGGLATALEARGCDLNDELWSAKVLLEDPDLIRKVGLDYLEAGADCIATASYQATIPGLIRRGLDEAAGLELLRLSVRLATEARDSFWEEEWNRFWDDNPNRVRDADSNRVRNADSSQVRVQEGERPPDGASGRHPRLKPLVAASIGPYGAYLADGSEYTGRYGLSESDLYEFHRLRWETLAGSGPDILACETVPSLPEARVLLRLIQETPGLWAWISFSCRDAGHISDGTPIREVAELCESVPRVAAVGVNCTPPELMAPLIGQLRDATSKPILVYPNSGESYDAVHKVWESDPSPWSWREGVAIWRRMRVAGIGGCCRVGPQGIREIRGALLPE